MPTYVYDADFVPVDDPDTSKGSVEDREIIVTHRYVIDSEEQGHWETVAEYENGGKDVEWRVDVPETGHWETFRDGDVPFSGYPVEIDEEWPRDREIVEPFSYVLYTPYTAEELEQIAKDKAEAERKDKIAELKGKLAESDYVILKISEYSVSGEQLSEEDAQRYAEIIRQRAQWRVQINELEAQDGA